MGEKVKIEQDLTLMIYNKIKEMILNRDLLPGEKINQKDLADQFGTSRTPIVYALHKLESEGIVDNLPNMGFYVHKLSINELLNLFYIREFLEVLAVQDLVDNATDGELQKLKELFNPYLDIEEFDQDEYRKADMKFHSEIIAHCSNTIAKKINENFQIFSRSYTAGLIRPSSMTLEEHEEIIDSLIERNKEKAEQAIKNHILITKNILQDTVNNLKKIKINPDNIYIDEVDFNDN
ncbi:GntR family transcriptional regulator [uncultured Sphaerochaeta sp.]|uniref:GntR family transcriptional regulator n=1 Tax=uncultured Sphaerochaeta sp. TaxID=886478 RepID=UPI002AA6D3CA|nr:GntR family transcriptional regulator [uncultured Sphaerochaeta sp.]